MNWCGQWKSQEAWQQAVKSFWLEEARLTPIVPMLSCLNRFADWAWKASFLPAWVAVILVIRRTADAKLVSRRVVSEGVLAGRMWWWRNIIGAGAATSIIFVATNGLSQQTRQNTYFVATNICGDKHNFVATMFCHSKHTFVATKMILVAAPANDIDTPLWWQCSFCKGFPLPFGV